jgi:hypothetical protein
MSGYRGPYVVLTPFEWRRLGQVLADVADDDAVVRSIVEKIAAATGCPPIFREPSP